jgi:hypothetical protein
MASELRFYSDSTLTGFKEAKASLRQQSKEDR